MQDLEKAKDVCMVSAYFLPPIPIRRALLKIGKRGGSVRIVTAGKTDVAMARHAGRSMYKSLLNSGARIYEYTAQVLHSKLVIIDDAVYVGSANLDNRSLRINHELYVRIEDAAVAEEVRVIFNGYLVHCAAIDPRGWGKARGAWEKLLERFASLVLARLDPWFAARRLSGLR